MFVKYISKKIQETLKARERALAWKTKNANTEYIPGTLMPKDINSRTTFVRMCSNKSNVPNIVISGGELDSLGQIQFGASVYKNTQSGFRPMAGIKDIEVRYKGGFKAMREATVNWVVSSIDDLDRLTPYFLTIGKTVVLDWGWTISSAKSFSQQFKSDPFITKTVNEGGEVDFDVNQSIFTNPQRLIQDKGGDYDAIGGQVINFDYTLRDDGGFDCVTKIIAIGASLFQKPIDSGGNQANIVNSEDKGSVYTPPDGLINAVINLRNIVVYNVFDLDWIPQVTEEQLTKKIFPRKTQEWLAAAGGTLMIIADGERSIDQVPLPKFPNFDDKNIYKSKVWNYAINVDNRSNPNVLWTVQPATQELDSKLFTENIFVTWGWFEDQFLNRYVSFTGGKAEEVKLTIRSIDTVLHDADVTPNGKEEGLPIFTEHLLDTEKLKYGTVHATGEISSELTDPTEVVKTPTLIRNPPLLYPVDPMKFFMSETFPIPADVELPDDRSYLGIFIDYAFSKDHLTEQYKFLHALVSSPILKKKKFKDPVNEKFGRLRNVWINIKEIQEAFGITNPDSGNKSDSNVRPVGTIEKAINALLVRLNNNFHNIWKFELVVDPFDSTNIKVIDTSDSVIKNPTYTKYKDNSHEVTKLGIYRFPSFKVGSLVKSQNLSFKIPTAQAITVMYGSNKNKGKGHSSEMNNGQLTKLFLGDDTLEYDDEYLKGLKVSHQNLAEGTDTDKEGNLIYIFKNSRIGSQGTNPNSKIGIGLEDGPVNLTAGADWWKRWTPGTTSDDSIQSNADIAAAPAIEKFIIGKDKDSGEDKLMFVTEVKAGSGRFKEKPEQESYYTYIQDETTEKISIKLKDDAAYALKSYLNASSPIAQFNMDSLIPAELSLEVDGIGGIVPGDIIHTDYIQNKYKTTIHSRKVEKELTEKSKKDQEWYNTLLSTPSVTNAGKRPKEEFKEVITITEQGPLAYFQVFGLSQKVDSSGWTTEIETKMRLNAMPGDGKLEYTVPSTRVGDSLKGTSQPVITVIPDADVSEETPLETSIDNENIHGSEIKANVDEIIPEADVNVVTSQELDPVKPGSGVDYSDTEDIAEDLVLDEFESDDDFSNPIWDITPEQILKDFHSKPDIIKPVVVVTEEKVIESGTARFSWDPKQYVNKLFSISTPTMDLKVPEKWRPPATIVEPINQEIIFVDNTTPEAETVVVNLPAKKIEEIVKVEPPKDEPSKVIEKIEPHETVDETNKKLWERKMAEIRRQQQQGSGGRRKGPPKKSTYEGEGWQNHNYLYKRRRDWRTKEASTSAQVAAGDYKNWIHSTEDGRLQPVPYEVRKAWWNQHIEAPQPGGVSKLSNQKYT